MLVIGLTGGIGSGKSTVAKLFAQLGVPIIDTDIIARDVVKKGEPALDQLCQHFGAQVLDKVGNLDRQRLRNLIFQNPPERIWLERLLHPLIRAEMQRQVAQLTTPYCICVIPLLFEATKPNELVNKILVVDVPESLQIERTQQRDKLTLEEVKAILNTQVSRTQRLQATDDIIVNDKDMQALKQQVTRLHEHYLVLANHKLTSKM